MSAADTVPPAGRAIWRRPWIIAVAAGVAVACLVIEIIIITGWLGTSSRIRASAEPAMLSVTVRWTSDTGYYAGSGPAAAGGTVYVGNENGTVYALDAVTGRVRWAYTTVDSVDSAPAVAGSTVYIGSRDGTVHALDAATGGLRWHYTTASGIDSSPAAAGGLVYIGTDDGMVYALRAP